MQLLGRSLASLVGLLILVAVIGHTNGQNIFPNTGPTCPSGTSCISLRSCEPLRRLLQQLTFDNLRRLQRALCGFNRRDPRVCCPGSGPTDPPTTPTQQPPTTPTQQPPTTPTQQPPTTPTSPPGDGTQLPANCGQRAFVQTRIFFGQDAPLGSYPWMALIGFLSSGNIVWGCGGTLITSRYIVTAGHCTAAEFTFNRQISVIRLGEHNLGTDTDCETKPTGRVCAPAHQDFTPQQIIRHPNFDTRGAVSDDIALIRLDRTVQFNDFVRPICLPPPGASVSSLLGTRQGEVAGWGTTENGPNTQILQSVRLPLVDKATCNINYRNSLIDEQICFGGEGRRDSCFGDSGGPVMAPGLRIPTYTFLALVSFGQPQCGVQGIPAVYTDITAYRSWIINNLRP